MWQFIHCAVGIERVTDRRSRQVARIHDRDVLTQVADGRAMCGSEVLRVKRLERLVDGRRLGQVPRQPLPLRDGQGSTVGLSLVTEPDELERAIATAAAFDAEVMLERYIPGRELTVGILDGVALAVGEIIPAEGDIFDYKAKYQAEAAEEIFPADVRPQVAEQIKALALRAHQALKLGSYSRVDFRMDPDEGLWVLEVNTLPGLSAGSLLPKSAQAEGIDFAELCVRICRGAISE